MIYKTTAFGFGAIYLVIGAIDSQVWIALFGAVVSLAATASLVMQAVMNFRLKKMELAQRDNHENIKEIQKQTNGMRAALERAAKAEGVIEGKATEKADEQVRKNNL